ncbi:hypothetical protein AVEN_31858-1 [Araneus ventricosus]|uniref:DUF5641 domain-containing protein n=1 Tax=Araneus ventricosus TaxID=182803 RepID=A0A4Y2F625_ARAVE|nr:hypothetical protein AVEN_31858-1 [Araneus ventricosus]
MKGGGMDHQFYNLMNFLKLCECSDPDEDYLPELKSKNSKADIVLTLNSNKTFFDNILTFLVNRSNKILTVVRILSFLFRFISNCRNPESKRKGPLISEELSEAEHYLIKQCQFEVFSAEVTAMMSGDNISNKSKFLNLSPFLDNKGVMRVGGRLENSQLPYSGKHPIILPSKADVDDLEILTPAHFLIGRSITAIVEPSLIDFETNRLNVWQRITKSVQTIWKRWSLSYLNGLQQRKNWVVNNENLKIGDMVLIREENLPPCKWLMGRVIALYPGQDNKRDTVCVKCAGPQESRNCPKPREIPAKCANCEGDHTVNYTGCPKKSLQLKKSSEEVELATTAWNNEARLERIRALRLVPRHNHLSTHPAPSRMQYKSNPSQTAESLQQERSPLLPPPSVRQTPESFSG